MVGEIIDGMKMPTHQRRGAKPKYPWLQLKSGQAFKFEDGISVASAKSMASHATAGSARFAVRKTADGIYCWRIDGTDWDMPNGNYRYEPPVIENYEPDPAASAEMTVVGYQPRKVEEDDAI